MAMSAGFLRTASASGDYLDADQVRELLLDKTYYESVIPLHEPGYKFVNRLHFHENGRLELRTPNSHIDISWYIEPDGRVCFPNRKGKMKCRWVLVEDGRLLMHNRRGMHKFTLSPHIHGM